MFSRCAKTSSRWVKLAKAHDHFTNACVDARIHDCSYGGGMQFFRAYASMQLQDLPGVNPLLGEKLAEFNEAEEREMQIWHRLDPAIQASLLQPSPGNGVGFRGWLGKQQSPLLNDSDYVGLAGVYKLFTDQESEALIALAGSEPGKNTPSKEETEAKYVGRYNTLRQAVKDRWLAGCLWQRLSKFPGDLVHMQYWNNVVGANASLRLVRTQPPRGNEKAGQHMKHVDTREDNADFLDAKNPEVCTRISMITVQGYLNPEEHEGGEFVVWPARLNLADPSNKKETILYEAVPESNPDLVSVKGAMKNGECVVFLQDTDQGYHGGAPVAGDKDKIAIRFVLDVQKQVLDPASLSRLYVDPEFGMGFTNDRSSINLYREGHDAARNTINCVERRRVA